MTAREDLAYREESRIERTLANKARFRRRLCAALLGFALVGSVSLPVCMGLSETAETHER